MGKRTDPVVLHGRAEAYDGLVEIVGDWWAVQLTGWRANRARIKTGDVVEIQVRDLEGIVHDTEG